MASCYCGDIHCSGESHDTLFNNMTLDEKHKNIVSRNGKCSYKYYSWDRPQRIVQKAKQEICDRDNMVVKRSRSSYEKWMAAVLAPLLSARVSTKSDYWVITNYSSQRIP